MSNLQVDAANRFELTVEDGDIGRDEHRMLNLVRKVWMQRADGGLDAAPGHLEMLQA